MFSFQMKIQKTSWFITFKAMKQQMYPFFHNCIKKKKKLPTHTVKTTYIMFLKCTDLNRIRRPITLG